MTIIFVKLNGFFQNLFAFNECLTMVFTHKIWYLCTMNFAFYKYQGTGNDFVIIDNRSLFFPKKDTALIARLCDRKYGVGSDGLMLLENHDSVDFKMVYFNADGRESSMCGNGGRCLTHFAKFIDLIEDKAVFEAIDGLHKVTIQPNGMVSLKMNDVSSIERKEDAVFLNTGSPHHVVLVEDLANYDVHTQGIKLRYGLYGDEGANINFVEQLSHDTFGVRTYERGVEAETLSCGTGVTAVALGMHFLEKSTERQITLQTPGGVLQVTFTKENDIYKDIFLKGAVEQVFKGEWYD